MLVCRGALQRSILNGYLDHFVTGKFRKDHDFAADGLDVRTQGADVHIFALFDPGNFALTRAHRFRERLLRESTPCAQSLKRLFFRGFRMRFRYGRCFHRFDDRLG